MQTRRKQGEANRDVVDATVPGERSEQTVLLFIRLLEGTWAKKGRGPSSMMAHEREEEVARQV